MLFCAHKLGRYLNLKQLKIMLAYLEHLIPIKYMKIICKYICVVKVLVNFVMFVDSWLGQVVSASNKIWNCLKNSLTENSTEQYLVSSTNPILTVGKVSEGVKAPTFIFSLIKGLRSVSSTSF